jgi:hypothetical protein
MSRLRNISGHGAVFSLRCHGKDTAVKLTERDCKLFRELERCRWLSTRQIARLLFPANHVSAVHRRLRVLRQNRYVVSRRIHQMAEAVHTLGRTGRDVLLDGSASREIRLEKALPKQIEHLLGINDIRIAVNKICEREGVTVEYFRPCWELNSKIWPFPVIPDALAMFTSAGKSARVLFEYDRGFEPPAYVLRTKFQRYTEGLDGFPFSLVVTVVETEARLSQLKEYTARHLPARSLFSFVVREELGDSTSVVELFS